ncbi:acyltransferase family protein [Acuticoccus kandeliae]|uniref:acyltransferase family protein n=1 Tax=Acuticoccus kandeliae TaxID=2073160 RepID=UPI000D3E373B|nr:acyltransferase [Acuticoccus kandeliae]
MDFFKDGTKGRSLGYIPALDGLRALAVLAVFAEHFTYNDLIRGFNPGMVGVRTFFVLSGFLITTILLNERGTAPVATLAARFWYRRVLRLMPVFLIAIALTWALNLGEMRQSIYWHLSYLSNVQVFVEHRWTGAGHFWTLAIEEQFYLLWFPLVMLLPVRWILPAIVAAILGSLAYRGVVTVGIDNFANVLLPGQLDSLAIGALLAIVVRTPRLAFLDRMVNGPALVAAGALAVVLLSPTVHEMANLNWPYIGWVGLPFLVGLGAAALVRMACTPGALARHLSHPALIHMGQISYGLYVWHYFVPQFTYTYIPNFHVLDEGALALVRTVIWVGLTFLLAELTWWLVERPLRAFRNLPRGPILTPAPA